MTNGEGLLGVLATNLPLGLFIVSVLITGHVVVFFLAEKKVKEVKHLKPTWLSIIFGLIINMLVMAIFKKNSFGDFSPYLLFSTWFIVGIITLIFSLGAHNYVKYGGKWISDKFIKGVQFFIVIGFGIWAWKLFYILMDKGSLQKCLDYYCITGIIIQKVLMIGLEVFLVYCILIIGKEVLKPNRYRRKKQMSKGEVLR